MYAATLAFRSALSKETNLFYANSYTKDTVNFRKQTNLFYTDGYIYVTVSLSKREIYFISRC